METAFRNPTNGIKHCMEKYHVWWCSRKPDQSKGQSHFGTETHQWGALMCPHRFAATYRV